MRYFSIKFGHVPHHFEESEEFDVTTRPSRYTRPAAIRLSSYATLSAQRFTRAPLIVDRPDGYKPGDFRPQINLFSKMHISFK